MNKKLYLSIFSVLILFNYGCGGSGDNSSSPPSSTLTLRCIHGVGDSFTSPTDNTIAGFADILSLNTDINNTTIEIALKLRSFPTTFDYNQPTTPNDFQEYGWDIHFDLNRDGAISHMLRHFFVQDTSVLQQSDLKVDISGDVLVYKMSKASNSNLNNIL